jgi:hypothetical protein
MGLSRKEEKEQDIPSKWDVYIKELTKIDPIIINCY